MCFYPYIKRVKKLNYIGTLALDETVKISVHDKQTCKFLTLES